MSDYYSEQSRAASSGRAGADRMAAGLGICVDEDRGDLDEVLRLRAEIARLREERRWIPVGERLPDLDVEVLVWQQGYTAIGWREHRPWYTVPKTIWTLGDELDKGYPPEKITHWMPLPAPPKGGEVE